MTIESASILFQGLKPEQTVWMSHTDYVDKLPCGFVGTARTQHTPFAAMEDSSRKFYGVQFHPEVEHTQNGLAIMRRFLFDVCGAKGDWSMDRYSHALIAQVRDQVGDGKVLLALSGGVDSSVVAALLSKAIGNQLTCIFVDHGLMRKKEGDEVEAAFSGRELNFVRVNAGERFLSKLKGVTDPEAKRKIIGEEFIRVFEEEAKKIGNVDFLAQGTIYPDVIESGAGDSAVIKSHHNVGGLPDHVDFKEIIEPLRLLLKMRCGIGHPLGPARLSGLAAAFPVRACHPPPGRGDRSWPFCGKATSSIGMKLARQGWTDIHQYFAVPPTCARWSWAISAPTITPLLPGDHRDFMTADRARIPYEVLERQQTALSTKCAISTALCTTSPPNPPEPLSGSNRNLQ